MGTRCRKERCKIKNPFPRLIRRGLYYVQTGAALGGLPLSLLNFATIFYYNAIANISFLGNIFTNFYIFVIISTCFFVMFFGLLGFGYKRRSKFFVSQVEVDIDANPYMRDKVVPNNVAIWELMVELFEKEKLDSTAICEMKRLLRNSGSKKYPLEEIKIGT
jgi:hypothetical protein